MVQLGEEAVPALLQLSSFVYCTDMNEKRSSHSCADSDC
jgi:hypothetical protein